MSAFDWPAVAAMVVGTAIGTGLAIAIDWMRRRQTGGQAVSDAKIAVPELAEAIEQMVNLEAHYLGCETRLQNYQVGANAAGEWVALEWDVATAAHYGGRYWTWSFSSAPAAVAKWLAEAARLPVLYAEWEAKRKADAIEDGLEEPHP